MLGDLVLVMAIEVARPEVFVEDAALEHVIRGGDAQRVLSKRHSDSHSDKVANSALVAPNLRTSFRNPPGPTRRTQ